MFQVTILEVPRSFLPDLMFCSLGSARFFVASWSCLNKDAPDTVGYLNGLASERANFSWRQWVMMLILSKWRSPVRLVRELRQLRVQYWRSVLVSYSEGPVYNQRDWEQLLPAQMVPPDKL